MLSLRIRLGILVWWLFLFFNIERIDVGPGEPIDIASFVYALAPIAAGIYVIAPRAFGRLNILWLVAPMVVVYFMLKIRLGYQTFGAALPLTIMEIVSLMITLLLARGLGTVMRDFEDTVDKLTFQQIGLPPRFYETVHAESLYREVKRSRRFGHPATMLILEPNASFDQVTLNKLLVEMQKGMVARYVQARIGKILSEELRDTDLIAQHGKGYAALLVETDADMSLETIRRLKSRASSIPGVQLKIGMADFPGTSLTLAGLLEAASKNVEADDSEEQEMLAVPKSMAEESIG